MNKANPLTTNQNKPSNQEANKHKTIRKQYKQAKSQVTNPNLTRNEWQVKSKDHNATPANKSQQKLTVTNAQTRQRN